jgi:hypothetical protein
MFSRQAWVIKDVQDEVSAPDALVFTTLNFIFIQWTIKSYVDQSEWKSGLRRCWLVLQHQRLLFTPWSTHTQSLDEETQRNAACCRHRLDTEWATKMKFPHCTFACRRRFKEWNCERHRVDGDKHSSERQHHTQPVHSVTAQMATKQIATSSPKTNQVYGNKQNWNRNDALVPALITTAFRQKGRQIRGVSAESRALRSHKALRIASTRSSWSSKAATNSRV